MDFFGGSFDPIHFGHINLAIRMQEKMELDGILFSPAFCSPHKKEAPPHAKPEDRCVMVTRAIADIEGFELSDWESSQKGYSYTIDALHFLSEQYALQGEEISWKLILAEDSITHFYRWKRAKDLLIIAPPLIGMRRGFVQDFDSYPDQKLAHLLQKNCIEIPMMDISSTDIRNRLKKKQFCGHLLPGKVLDFIYKHHLYYL